jgi:glucose-6-phosphate isomerase
MDGQLSDLLHQLRPETTLFIISSKSFGTIDTLYNVTARQWLEKQLGQSEAVDQHHFIGVSTKPEKMVRTPKSVFALGLGWWALLFMVMYWVADSIKYWCTRL